MRCCTHVIVARTVCQRCSTPVARTVHERYCTLVSEARTVHERIFTPVSAARTVYER
jgi:hypothetical protein